VAAQFVGDLREVDCSAVRPSADSLASVEQRAGDLRAGLSDSAEWPADDSRVGLADCSAALSAGGSRVGSGDSAVLRTGDSQVGCSAALLAGDLPVARAGHLVLRRACLEWACLERAGFPTGSPVD
jgi:hypothetical protein